MDKFAASGSFLNKNHEVTPLHNESGCSASAFRYIISGNIYFFNDIPSRITEHEGGGSRNRWTCIVAQGKYDHLYHTPKTGRDSQIKDHVEIVRTNLALEIDGKIKFL